MARSQNRSATGRRACRTPGLNERVSMPAACRSRKRDGARQQPAISAAGGVVVHALPPRHGAREADQIGEPLSLGVEGGARRGDAVVPLALAAIGTPPGIVDFFDPADVGELLERSVQRRRPQTNALAARLADVARHGQSVAIARREREQDVVPV
jgi:hypothetical protein